MSDFEISLIYQTDSVDNLSRRSLFCSMNFAPFNQMDLISVMWNSFDAFIYLNFTLTSPLTHYINCSTLFSAIILRVLIILLVKHIHILIVTIFIIIITIVVVIIINLFYLFISFNIYLVIYFIFPSFIYLFFYRYVDLFDQNGVRF